MPPCRTLVLFNYDWDQLGFARWAHQFRTDSAGFDLFTFPSNTRPANFDLQRFVERLAQQAGRLRWQAVISNHEQFGALAAALLAERMGWLGTPVAAVISCQHKLLARQVLQSVAPEANADFEMLASRYGEAVPEGIVYPVFVKPVKAAFSVLARIVRNREALELAQGRDPGALPRATPSAGAAGSFVYRTFDPAAYPQMPTATRQRTFARQFPDAMLFRFPKTGGQIARDFKWLGSYRYGILHLGGRDMLDLRARCDAASEILAWPSLCARSEGEAAIFAPAPAFALETS